MTDLDLARQHISNLENQLFAYANAVGVMRHLQRIRSVHEPMAIARHRDAAEQEADNLTAMYVLPPIPPAPDLTAPPTLTNEQMHGEGTPLEGADKYLTLIGSRFSAPTYAVTLLTGRVVVRVDDEKNKLAWVELAIAEELVGAWWKWFTVEQQHDEEEEGQFDGLPGESTDHA